MSSNNLKKSILKQTAAVLVVAAIACTGCKKDPELEPIMTMTMTMTTAKAGEVAIYLAGAGTAVVDWGDESEPEMFTLSAYNGNIFVPSKVYRHTFSGTSARNTVIDGQNITYLGCSSNKLSNLDVSNNTVLEGLYCPGNQLHILDVSNNTLLKSLYCGHNQLTSLDVSNNTALTELNCGSNWLTSLDVSNNIVLTILVCNSNQLTNLDVGKNTVLRHLDFSRNQLTSLDVGKNTVLRYLDCSFNQLTSLDVSKNTAMDYLSCWWNELTSLDVGKNTALRHLVVKNNRFTVNGLNVLFDTLHGNIVAGEKTVGIGDNPGTIGCNRSIATEKGWTVYN